MELSRSNNKTFQETETRKKFLIFWDIELLSSNITKF